MFSVEHVKHPEQVRTAYDELYTRQWLPPRTAMFTWIVHLLQAHPGGTLLDVACGNAQLRHAAQKAGLIYYGIDISYNAVRGASNARTIVGDGACLPFGDNGFDYVVSVGSLEHYWDMAQGVREIARVLKPEGQACVLVPNAFGLTWNVLRVWRTGDLADDDSQPIQRFGTCGAWHRLLSENGLEVRQIHGYERAWPQTRDEWRAYLVQPKEIILALLAPFLPLNLRRCFVFLCTKASSIVSQRKACPRAQSF